MPANANVYWTDTIATAASLANEAISAAVIPSVAASDYQQNLVVVATITATPDVDTTAISLYIGYGLAGNIVSVGGGFDVPSAGAKPGTVTVVLYGQLPVGTHSIFVQVEFIGAIAPCTIDAVTAVCILGD